MARPSGFLSRMHPQRTIRSFRPSPSTWPPRPALAFRGLPAHPRRRADVPRRCDRRV